MGGPRTPIWEDLASILSKLFHFIRFHAHHSISFQPHSIPFYPFHSIPFKKHKALKLQVGRASEPSRFRASWLPDASRPRRDSRSVNNLKVSEVSERIQTHPDASERIRTHPNASEQVRAGLSKSENFKKLKKTSKILRNVRKTFAKIFAKAC